MFFPFPKGWHGLSSTLMLAVILYCQAATLAHGEAPTEASPLPADLERSVDWTEELRQWAEQKEEITVGFDPHWPPFSYVDRQGRIDGYDVELIRRITRLAGLRVNAVTDQSWNGVYRRALNGEIDVLSSTAYSPEAAGAFLFTRPYYHAPVVIATHRQRGEKMNMEKLRDFRIAVPNEYIVTKTLERSYPHLDLMRVPTMQDAFSAIQNKEAHASLTGLPNAVHLISSNDFTDLRIAGITPLELELRFAIRKELPELVRILNYGLTNLAPAELDRMHDRHLNVGYEKLIVWGHVRSFFIIAATLALGALLIMLFWNLLLRQANVQNRALVHELSHVRDELAQLNEEQARLLGMVAHDLKNPLTAVALNADMLRLKRDPKPSTIQRIAGEVSSLTRRMQRLVQQVLDFQKLAEKRQRLKKEWLDLRQPISDSIALLKPLAASKGIELREIYPDAPVYFEGNADALARITENLVSNALKFSPTDSSTTVCLAVEEKTATLSVADQGPGIPENEIDQLFQRFAKLSTQPTAQESSTGLGLAIVKQLVEQLGGLVAFENHPEGGAVFSVSFPLSTPPTQLTEALSSEADSEHAGMA